MLALKKTPIMTVQIRMASSVSFAEPAWRPPFPPQSLQVRGWCHRMNALSSFALLAMLRSRRSRRACTTVHGTPVRDDYAWLKADELERGAQGPATPAGARSAPISKRRTPTRPRPSPSTEDLQQAPRRGDARAHQGGRCTVPQPRRAVRLFHPLPRGRAAPPHLPPAARRRRREILLDGDKEAEGRAFFDLGDAEHSPDHRLLAWSADTKGSEYYTIRVRDLATGADLADEVARTSGEIVWLGDSSGFYYVELDENHRPVRVQAPPARRRPRGRRAHLRGDRPGLVRRRSTRRNPAPSSIIDGERSRDVGNPHPRPARDSDAAPRLVAAAYAADPLRRRASRRRARHPHQRRRRRGLQDRRRRRSRHPGARNWRDLVPAPARRHDPVHVALARPSRAPRARGRQAAHRRARHRDAAAKHDHRLRRGGLFARHRRRATSSTPTCIRFAIRR